MLEVAVPVEAVLRERLIEVLLESSEADDVALLVDAVRLLVPALQAVVRKVSKLESARLVGKLGFLRLVRVRQVTALHFLCRVLGRAGPQVADIVKVEVKRARGNCPNADVKLAVLVQQWPLEVLLDDPVAELQR